MSEMKQPFPISGTLKRNLDLSLPALKKRLRSATGGVHSYVVRSAKWNRAAKGFAQGGSAPNFQGDYLTLCTCKHQMRATQDADAWRDTWIAGFASRCLGHHWLFYLAKVAHVFESQYDLWTFLATKPKNIRDAKSSLNDPLGDVFKPKGVLRGQERFDPARYRPPRGGHSHHQDGCDSNWFGDIRYAHADRYSRQPSLLVGSPTYSFLWKAPTIRFKGFHARNFTIWESISEFLEMLKGRG